MLNALVAWWGRNPVAGNLLMLACAIAGALSFARMEKEFFPPGRDNSVRVEAVWPGASPEDMESQVTVRVEEALADLDGVNWVRSRSMEGFAWVNVIANPGVDMAGLTAEVRSRVDAVSGLPAGIEPPTVSQNIGRNFSIILGIHGKVDERTLRQTAERIRDEIALLPGATNIQVTGARRPEVSIEVSEEKLRQFGLRFDDVANAIRATSINLSSGSVRTADGDYQLRARNLADSEVEFGKIIVRQTPDGGAIRLSDVAAIIDGYQDVNVFSKLNGEPAVTLFVLTADKFNILETSKAVDAYLKTKASQLPTGVSISKMYDERDDFSALMDILMQNAIQGFALIFILLLLTLHPKVAIWATFGVMTAFAGSFFILPYVDVSLNFMTVFGFLLVLGIMVDDAIIVGEAVYERVERGHHGVDAAIVATQLVLKPLVASVLVTMLAFSPMMFLSGEVQQFTRAISIVVMSTLFFSLIESLIILPGHLGHVKPLIPGPTPLGRLAGLQVACANSVVWFARAIYGPMMRACVRWRYVTLAVFVVAFMAAVALVGSNRIKQTFMPDVEGDFMQASIELPRTTPFSRMEEVAAQLDAARLALEQETKSYAIEDPFTGKMSNGVVRSWTTAIEENSVRAYVTLTPPESRKDMRSKAITERMKALLGTVPDADRVSFELNGGGNGPAIQIAILGADQAELRAAVDTLKAKLLGFSAVTSVRDSEEAAIEELRFAMKPGAEQLGVTLSDVSSQVRQAYFGEEVQRLPRDGEDVRVYVRYPASERKSLTSLETFRIRTADGREIPLAAVADVSFAPGVTGLDRRQRMRSILVEAEAPDESRTQIMRELETSGFFKELEARHPGISRKAIGEAEAQKEFFEELSALGLMALFAMYALLAVVFRSYWQPALIMSVIPFAFVGAAVGHFMFGASFALFSWLGMIAAMGVIVNDNVVLVDKANQLRAEGQDAFSGVTDAGVSRFRQIFLTSITEFIGLAPMIFEMATIAQFLKPMAISLAFGVLLAMPATLILTPVLYMIGKDVKSAFGGARRSLGRMWAGAPSTSAAE